MLILTKPEKAKIRDSFFERCNYLINNKIKLEHGSNDVDFIKKNILPDWYQFRDIKDQDLRKLYLKNELSRSDQLFLDKIINTNYVRYDKFVRKCKKFNDIQNC